MFLLKRHTPCNVFGGARGNGGAGSGGAGSGGAGSGGAGSGGAGASNGDNPLDSNAAITNRDGIVGAWDLASRRAPPGLGKRATVDKASSLEDWEPWVRGTVFDVELLAPLCFGPAQEDPPTAPPADPDRGFQLNFRTGNECSGATGAERLVSLYRPLEDVQSMTRQLKLVFEHADLREDRQNEILSQMPQLASYWTSVAGLHPTRTRWTLELLAAAVRLAISVEMRFKHALALPRPVQYSAQIQPMIQTPGHSSYPSGHSTEAHCTAAVLRALIPGAATEPIGQLLLKQAERIAVNRTVAGLHFPVDSRAGQILGTCLAEYIVDRCRAEAQKPIAKARTFNPDAAMNDNFPATGSTSADVGNGVEVPAMAASVPRSELLGWLWLKAADEWK